MISLNFGYKTPVPNDLEWKLSGRKAPSNNKDDGYWLQKHKKNDEKKKGD